MRFAVLLQYVAYERPALSKAYLFPEGKLTNGLDIAVDLIQGRSVVQLHSE